MPQLAAFAVAVFLVVYAALQDPGGGGGEVRGTGWWALTTALHLPFFVILLFGAGGLVERVGFFWKGRTPETAGQLPPVFPTVFVQLPMFNEHAVAQRVIEAAAAITWPRDRFSVQVLDDSTDDDTRVLVERVCADITASTGVRCYVRHRQASWMVLFATGGLIWCALGAGFMAACVLTLAFHYGDHAGKVFFVVDRRRLSWLLAPASR